MRKKSGLRMHIEDRYNLPGFTLIEIIAVIALAAVVIASMIALINPQAQVQKAMDARRKSDLTQFQRTLEMYYHDFGVYPPNGTFTFGNAWQPYTSRVPNDPNPVMRYAYWSTGQAYYVYAHLDRGANDPQACTGGGVCPNASVFGLSCGGVCNFGVTSPNVSP